MCTIIMHNYSSAAWKLQHSVKSVINILLTIFDSALYNMVHNFCSRYLNLEQVIVKICEFSAGTYFSEFWVIICFSQQLLFQ